MIKIEYTHGIYAEIERSGEFLSTTTAGVLPIYIGLSPVHQRENYLELINNPILISDFENGKKLLGYSDTDFLTYTISQALYCHFNTNNPIGPIIAINILNPFIHKKSSSSNENIKLINNKQIIQNENIIINTFSIPGKEKGIDYNIYYDDTGKNLIIEGIGKETFEGEAEFYEILTSKIEKEEILKAIDVVKNIYQKYNKIPTIICCPMLSSDIDINNKLQSTATKINGHWYAYVNSDVSTTSNDIENAIIKKKLMTYKNNNSPCWPFAKINDKIVNLSTIATVTMMQTDFNNDNIPFESPSNKLINIDYLCNNNGDRIIFDQIEANKLNSNGIRTCDYFGGAWKLWGSHTGVYDYESKDKIMIEDIFDSSQRMIQYIANDFQLKYGNTIDKPMTRALKDTIINDYQERIDGLIKAGALIAGDIIFNELSNPISDMVEGDFIYNLILTNTIPNKSTTLKIKTTSAGLTTFFDGGE